MSSFTSIALNPEPSVAQVGLPPPAFATTVPSSTRIPFSDELSPNFEWLMSREAPDAPPSNIVTTPQPSTAPVISPVAIPHLIPRRSIPPRSPFATGLSLPSTSLTDRRTPVSPSVFAAKLLPRGLTPAPVQAHSPLAVAVGWDRAVQEALDTPIEEEDHHLDVDMGDYGDMNNEDTSESTPLRGPVTDDDRPPPGTPNGEDMELDVNVFREGDTSIPVIPVQAPSSVPARVASVSLITEVVERT